MYHINNKKFQILVFATIAYILFSCKTSESIVSTQNACQATYDTAIQEKVYSFVSKMPEYLGGNVALIKFIAENFTYPQQDYFQAFFLLEFIIDSDGKPINIGIKGKSDIELTKAEKELIKVLNKMPKWQPGECNGKKVPVRIFLPLNL